LIYNTHDKNRDPEDMRGCALSRLGEKLSVLLYQPEIPQNTGNIARTCAATHTPLYLVGPLGFRITDKQLKRAGLDYWPYVRMKLYPDFEAARIDMLPSRLVYFSAHAPRQYYDFSFRTGDCLVFGPETRGLPQELLASYPGDVVQVPIDRLRVRSLNLATTVGIALFEALRQLRY
jgi:tRNA (cytidine/uridine-2'-O-)-methyltransferase